MAFLDHLKSAFAFLVLTSGIALMLLDVDALNMLMHM